MEETTLRLLLVEDDELFIPPLEAMLSNLGYEIAAVCMSYAEALCSLKQHDYDLALLDINLNGSGEREDGTALGAQLRGKKPFIYLTGLHDKATIRRAASTNPSAYLLKPIQEAQLFSAIQLAISNHQNHKTANLQDSTKAQESFYVRIGREVRRVKWESVYGLQASGNYVEVLCRDSSVAVPVRGSLKSFLSSKLPPSYQKLFIRLGRSTLLHRSIIKRVTEEEVITTYGNFETTRGKMIQRELGSVAKNK